MYRSCLLVRKVSYSPGRDIPITMPTFHILTLSYKSRHNPFKTITTLLRTPPPAPRRHILNNPGQRHDLRLLRPRRHRHGADRGARLLLDPRHIEPQHLVANHPPPTPRRHTRPAAATTPRPATAPTPSTSTRGAPRTDVWTICGRSTCRSGHGGSWRPRRRPQGVGRRLRTRPMGRCTV